MTPEGQSRQHIDRKLNQAGWAVQDMKQLNLAAALGAPGVIAAKEPRRRKPKESA